MTYRSNRPSGTRQLVPSQRVARAVRPGYLAIFTRAGWRVYFGEVPNKKFEIYRSDQHRLTHKMADRIEQAIAIDRLYRGPA